MHCLKLVCKYLGIPFRFDVYSAMGLNVEPFRGPGEWVLNICKAIGASSYLNPPGGAGLYNADQFEAEGIELEIQQFKNMKYDTGPYSFEAGLSIIDVLMWITPQEIRNYLMKTRSDHVPQ